MTAQRYTIVVVDQDNGATFTLTRTPIGTTIDGTHGDGHTLAGSDALAMLHDITVDQQLESLEAGL